MFWILSGQASSLVIPIAEVVVKVWIDSIQEQSEIRDEVLLFENP